MFGDVGLDLSFYFLGVLSNKNPPHEPLFFAD